MLTGYAAVRRLRRLVGGRAVKRGAASASVMGRFETGTRMVRHARYAIFHMTEAALPRSVFTGLLALINGLRGPPVEAAST